VEALAVPHAEKAPLRVARPLAAAVRDLDPVVREHALEERGVTRLLVALHRDRLAQCGVGLDVGHGGDARARRPLAAHGLAPGRERAEADEVVRRELRPADVAHLVRMEGVDELATEERPVTGASDRQCWHACSRVTVRPLYRADGGAARRAAFLLRARARRDAGRKLRELTRPRPTGRTPPGPQLASRRNTWQLSRRSSGGFTSSPASCGSATSTSSTS